MEFVSVRVLSYDSTLIKGTLSDSLGKYIVNDIGISNGILHFSSIGFKPATYRFSLKETDEPLNINMTLDNDVHLLDEVIVNGQSVLRGEQGQLVALPSQKQKRHSFGGFNLLSNMMIPGVKVDIATGEVSALFGTASTYINGIKANKEEIRSLRAKDVIKVEYFDAPTGKYTGENAVVNFVVKSYSSGGFGELSARQSIGFLDGSYDFAGKIAQKNSTIRLFGGYGLSKLDSDRRNGVTHYVLKEGTLTELTHALIGENRSDKTYIQSDITNSTNKRTLQGAIFFNRNNTPYEKSVDKVSYSGALISPDLTQERNISDLGCQGGMRLYGSFSMGHNQHFEAGTTLSYTENSYDYHMKDSGGETDYYATTSFSEEHLWNWDINISYTKYFHHRNSLSIKIINLYKNSNADYSGINEHRTSLWSNEDILFIQYFHPLSNTVNLSFQPGISSLQYQQINKKRISIFSPRLNFRLSARLPQNQFLMTSCNIGNSFPDIASLSSAEQVINQFHIIKGNPDIDNTKLYQILTVYGINSRHFGIQGMVQYQYNHSVPVRSFFTEGMTVVESWTTEEDAHYINTNLSLTYRPVERINLQLTGGYNRYQYTGYQDSYSGSWEATMNASMFIGYIMVNAHVSTPQSVMGMDLARVKTPWKYGCSINYAIKNWKIEAVFDNPFIKNNRYIFESFNPVYNYNYSLTSRRAGCSGYIKVSLEFDFGKSIKKEDLKLQQINIDNSLIKAH